MFSEDYGHDDELSADERGQSPRGPGGSAVRFAKQAEDKMNKGIDIFGGRRSRGSVGRAPFGGESFGIAPKDKDLLHMSSIDASSSGDAEHIIELRDYSSKAVLKGASAGMQSRQGDPLADMKRMEARLGSSRTSASDSAGRTKYLHEDKEASLLSGSSVTQQSSSNHDRIVESVMAGIATASSSSSSSSSSSITKKKKKKKHKKSKGTKPSKEKKQSKKGEKKKKKKKDKAKKRKREDGCSQAKGAHQDVNRTEDVTCIASTSPLPMQEDSKRQRDTFSPHSASPLSKGELMIAAAEKRAAEALSRGIGDTAVVDRLRKRS